MDLEHDLETIWQTREWLSKNEKKLKKKKTKFDEGTEGHSSRGL